MIISLLFSEPVLFFAIFIALVISITFHEFSHVFTARLLGDRTGEYAGRLTLNPLAHLDFFGTIAILLVGFGWGKPAPFNPYNLKNQRFGPAMVALGGPAANLVLIIIFGLLLKIFYPMFGPTSYVTIFLQVLVTFNGVLMVFNLIPIPPLDGSHILGGILGTRFARFSEALNAYGPRILFFLIFISVIFNISVFSYIIYPIVNFISKLLGVPLLF
ncbi:MAG: site-2 protease family protein [Patescibacteria group bacterium]|jgi:Zn-dependent protease